VGVRFGGSEHHRIWISPCAFAKLPSQSELEHPFLRESVVSLTGANWPALSGAGRSASPRSMRRFSPGQVVQLHRGRSSSSFGSRKSSFTEVGRPVLFGTGSRALLGSFDPFFRESVVQFHRGRLVVSLGGSSSSFIEAGRLIFTDPATQFHRGKLSVSFGRQSASVTEVGRQGSSEQVVDFKTAGKVVQSLRRRVGGAHQVRVSVFFGKWTTCGRLFFSLRWGMTVT
jgi:hypothetical protein